MRLFTLTLSIFALCLGSLATGCGKKSAPVAPELSAPGPIKAIQAKGENAAVLLQWSRPTVNASGDPLNDLRQFHVLRAPVIRGERPSFTKIASIDVPADPTKIEFTYTDKDLISGRAFEYQVIAVSADGIISANPKTVRVNFKGIGSTVEIY